MADDDVLTELQRMREQQEQRDRDILARLERRRPPTADEKEAENRALMSSGYAQNTEAREAAKRGGDAA